jgi:hypothetical protein
MHIPILEERLNGKLMFTLLPKRNVFYTNIVLLRALQFGYKILKIHTAMHWAEEMKGFMVPYVDLFYKMKSDAKKAGNDGLCSVAKIHLNGGYGKWGERLAHKYTQQHILRNNESSVKIFHEADRKNEIKKFKILNNECVLLSTAQPEPPKDTIAASQCVQYAVFVTAGARLKLFDEFLFPLQKRVLYCDTDSVIYTMRKGLWRPPEKNELGGAVDELKGCKIAEFCSTGAKSYAYRLENGDCVVKMKGFPLKKLQGELGYSEMLEVALSINANKPVSTAVTYEQIRRHENWGLDTRTIQKIFKHTFTKRVLLPDGISEPLKKGSYPIKFI